MTERSHEPARWEYRFEHYGSAYSLLQITCDDYQQRTFSDLEKEGLLARFSFTWELGWKLLKDYLQSLGVSLEAIAPKPVIRAALVAGLIDDASLWMDALDTRNGLAHVYSQSLRDAALSRVCNEYIGVFKDLHHAFAERFDAARRN